MPLSKALEVNLESSRFEVRLDPKYDVLKKITAGYAGLGDTLQLLLTEVCHPLKNWGYVLEETRRFALHNYHLFLNHPGGPEGARLFTEIFLDGAVAAKSEDMRSDAVDNLLVYLLQIVQESGDQLHRFTDVLNSALTRLSAFDDDGFSLAVRSYYDPGRLAHEFIAAAPPDADFGPMSLFLRRCLERAYFFWLEEADPSIWFHSDGGEGVERQSPPDLEHVFYPVSHKWVRHLLDQLAANGRRSPDGSREALETLIEFPTFRDFVSLYDRIPKQLAETADDPEAGREWQLRFLFRIMGITWLSSLHERTLREINRNLARMIASSDPPKVKSLIASTFRMLTRSMEKFPATALNLVLNIGQAVYRTGNGGTIEFFVVNLIELGFQTPDLSGVGDDWEIRANAAHIQNIRTWLNLIGLKPIWSKRLLSSLIVNLALFGVFIKDTDLFPRDITGLLNADIGPVYNLVKQACRLFPSYFNEIGAEGRLRDVSTRLDDINYRRDTLIHFLRKQSHVESSPETVSFTGAVFDFWLTRDKTVLRKFLPPHLYETISADGPLVDGMHRLVQAAVDDGLIGTPRDFLDVSEEDLQAFADAQADKADGIDRERLVLAHAMYLMLHQKYNAGISGLEAWLNGLSPFFGPDLSDLRSALKLEDDRLKLNGILDFLEKMKEVILSPEKFEIREDIYYKRHIAVDIPSMYGTYHETKFDALGLTFRLEPLVNILFQELVDGLDLRLITRGTFVQILDYLRLFDRALRLDGIRSRELEHQMDMLAHSLDIRGFSFTQFLDIFRGLSQAVSNLVNDYFNNIHHSQAIIALGREKRTGLLPKYLPAGQDLEPKDLADRVIEIFLRDRIATSLGLQQLDQFVTETLNTLFLQDHKLRREMLRSLLNYDPDKAATPIHPVSSGLNDVIHLGAKGFNLVRLTSLGFPVPPGFIVTTEVFRCRDVIDEYGPAREHFNGLLERFLKNLERQTGRRFGDSKAPLLLSVRSGSSVSQPGMLNTFLNVGISEDIVEGMAGGPGNGEWFAWDCYRRYLQSFGMAAGLSRDAFDDLMLEAKKTYGIPYKRQFSGRQMKAVARTYKSFILSHGVNIEEHPFEQLYRAVKGVFDSWTSSRAQTYRGIMNISGDWGTAVTVQAMVFGNLSEKSGAGVFFTHNPRWSGDNLMLWGDFALCNQGEDVVSGLVETLPVSLEQAEIERRPADVTLETHFPQVYRQIANAAREMIFTYGYSPQEMEFTFEGPQKNDLFFLQTRDMVLRERRDQPGFDPSSADPEKYLGRGIGVSGGCISGRIVFSLGDIKRWKNEEPSTPLILVRGDTVPDDIKEIHEADGLLTARGGSTSHAAIVAYRLHKTCVVGCADLVVREHQKTCILNGVTLTSGDWISLDGLGGSIFKGRIQADNDIRQEGAY